MKSIIEKYNEQKNSDSLTQIQEPFETTTNLYVWETWTWNKDGVITDIRYYCEDVNGGKTLRISKEDFIYFTTKQK